MIKFAQKYVETLPDEMIPLRFISRVTVELDDGETVVLKGRDKTEFLRNLESNCDDFRSVKVTVDCDRFVKELAAKAQSVLAEVARLQNKRY